MNQPLSKPLFITFEGLDKAGKSTLLASLSERFEEAKIPFVLTKEPGGHPFLAHLRSLLLTETESLDRRAELFLFLADRAEHVSKVILPALLEGKVVLCDRYSDSTFAYQGNLMPDPFLELLLATAENGVVPTKTFLLDIDPKETALRGEASDQMEKRDLAFKEKVRERYLMRADLDPKRFILLDATNSRQILLEKAWEEICGLLNR